MLSVSSSPSVSSSSPSLSLSPVLPNHDFPPDYHNRYQSHHHHHREKFFGFNVLISGIAIGVSASWLAYNWLKKSNRKCYKKCYEKGNKKTRNSKWIWRNNDDHHEEEEEEEEEKEEYSQKLVPSYHPDVVNTSGLPPSSSSSSSSLSSYSSSDFPLSFGSRAVIGRSHGARPSVLSDWYFINDGALLSLSTPICLAATYRFRDANQAARLCEKDTRVHSDEDGFLYARWSNPTNDAAARTIAHLEGAKGSLLFASGMSAISSTLTALLSSGDHIVACQTLYGGTFEFLTVYAKKNGIDVTFVKADKIENFSSAIKSNTKLIYTESPCNPTVRYTDLFALGAVCLERKLTLVVDSTFATPFLTPTLRIPGVSISIQSCTKYLGGHSDLIAGSVSSNNEELLKLICKAQKILGGTLDGFQSFLLIRGLKTLHVRMPRHGFNALTIAKFLENHPAIASVYYPGLPSHPDHKLAKKLIETLSQPFSSNSNETSEKSEKSKEFSDLDELYDGVSARGFGGMMSFEVRGGITGGKVFCESLRLINLAVSLGSVESLLCHSASMTHMMVPRKARMAGGITDGMIRFSVGIEDVRDLLQDIKQALEITMKKVDFEKEEKKAAEQDA